jgi:hypothetical protein
MKKIPSFMSRMKPKLVVVKKQTKRRENEECIRSAHVARRICELVFLRKDEWL